MRKQANKTDKLKVLKSILTGDFNVNALREPQVHFVYKEEDQDLYRFGLGEDACEMNQDQYQEWLSTLNDRDSVVIFSTQPGNDQIDEPIKEETVKTIRKKKKARIVPLKAFGATIKESPTGEAQLPTLTMESTGGKMSEYGITWGRKVKDTYCW